MKALLPAVVLALLLPVPAQAATWRMNEQPSARIMHDSAGNLDGRIGNRLTPGGGVYRFPGIARGVNRHNLAWVPDNPALNPRSGRFVVTIRFRMRHQWPGPNLIQKGQARQTGGYWKIEVHQDRPTCHFRDAHGVTSAVRGPHSVADRRWHTVRCSRGPAGTRIVVRTGRHRVVRVNPKPTGYLNNSRPVSIGGKYDCAGIDKEPAKACDYLIGQVDRVRVVSS